MKVLHFKGDPIITEFAGEDLYRVVKTTSCTVWTDVGVLRYTIHAGFITDMRSGSHAIDWIIPKFTNNIYYNWAILIHDANYTLDKDGNHNLNRETADLLLREMTRVSKTLNALQRFLMYNALRLFGNSAYKGANTGVYTGMENYMNFEWSAK